MHSLSSPFGDLGMLGRRQGLHLQSLATPCLQESLCDEPWAAVGFISYFSRFPGEIVEIWGLASPGSSK